MISDKRERVISGTMKRTKTRNNVSVTIEVMTRLDKENVQSSLVIASIVTETLFLVLVRFLVVIVIA